MRHATTTDLDRAEALLGELRAFPALKERRRGYFSRAGHAFIHFHAEGDDLYVDVKLDRSFRRLSVTTAKERADFIKLVKQGLGPPVP